jgi:hypothetical protein
MFRNTTLVSIVYCLRSTETVCMQAHYCAVKVTISVQENCISLVITQRAMVIPYRRLGKKNIGPIFRGPLKVQVSSTLWRKPEIARVF